ncbi:MAG: hypothetical protein K0R50_2145 [Eubacterium sp.]|jgi:phenylpyruvate tautomerase PptA (4-oxalocrotonate tautomerase family)|nr:hypothetical protein [Eubacterium sp.]
MKAINSFKSAPKVIAIIKPITKLIVDVIANKPSNIFIY